MLHGKMITDLNGHEAEETMTAIPDAMNCAKMFMFVFLSAVPLVSGFMICHVFLQTRGKSECSDAGDE